MAVVSALASRVLFKAEGKGLEPSTPCGATDFESTLNVRQPFDECVIDCWFYGA